MAETLILLQEEKQALLELVAGLTGRGMVEHGYFDETGLVHGSVGESVHLKKKHALVGRIAAA